MMLRILPSIVGLAFLVQATLSAAPVPSRGFNVNIKERNSVLAFWHSTYMASEGYHNRVNWTGNYKGNNGSTSLAFVRDVERRTNFFRALCGVSSDIRFNTSAEVVIEPSDPFKPSADTSKTSAAQASALLIARNYNDATGSSTAFAHNPLPTVVGFSAAAWNGNAMGNLAMGLYGPGAVDGYFLEEVGSGSVTSPWNNRVGHRRWLLFSEASNFATGDQPGFRNTIPPSNVLYVTHAADELETPATRRFVAYPPAGHFPAPLNSHYWSLSHADADFSNAKVTVTTRLGKAIPIVSVVHDKLYAEPAIVWQVSGAAAAKNINKDLTFKVRVTGIQGPGLPSTVQYNVTLMNPEKLLSNQAIAGPSILPFGNKALYRFNRPEFSQAVRAQISRITPGGLLETAEIGRKTEVIPPSSQVYPFVTAAKLSGRRAFNLTFPTAFDPKVRGVPEQIFELGRDLLPKAGAGLTFKYKRGFMTPSTHLSIECSRDGGVTWKRIGAQISGAAGTPPAKVFNGAVKLPKSAVPLRIRFRYHCDLNSSIFVYDKQFDTGIFIDDIATRNCDIMTPVKIFKTSPTAKGFFFGKGIAPGVTRGSVWALTISSQLGGEWFPPGPIRRVTIR